MSMGFSRQEYWSGLPCPSPGDLPNAGIESRSLALQVDSLPSETPGESVILHTFSYYFHLRKTSEGKLGGLSEAHSYLRAKLEIQ